MSSKSLAKIAFPFIQLDSKQFRISDWWCKCKATQQQLSNSSTECCCHTHCPPITFAYFVQFFFPLFLLYLRNELLLYRVPCNHWQSVIFHLTVCTLWPLSTRTVTHQIYSFSAPFIYAPHRFSQIVLLLFFFFLVRHFDGKNKKRRSYTPLRKPVRCSMW